MEATTDQNSRPLNDVQGHCKATQPQRLPINSPRQYRLILAILEGAKSTRDLIQIVGANNVPDVVMNLRGSGWQIHCDRVPVFDRDGNKVAAGQYRLITDQETAKNSLKAYKGAK
ncbi:MAG: hypothetical protein IE928_08385 [Gammaproteobacteria bacterium]|nr:hypothetical protein [Gammaproteobacteria bacterium]